MLNDEKDETEEHSVFHPFYYFQIMKSITILIGIL